MYVTLLVPVMGINLVILLAVRLLGKETEYKDRLQVFILIFFDGLIVWNDPNMPRIRILSFCHP